MPWFLATFFVIFAIFLTTRLLFWRRAGHPWGYGGGCYGYAAYPPPYATALSPEENLRQRLARGEIDVSEYERQRDALRK